MNEAIQGTITSLWRPIYAKLEKGVQMLTPEYARLQSLTNFERFGMRGIFWPVELVHGGGIAWTQNRGSTARASSNEPVEATDTWKHMVGRFDVGFDELEAENDSKFASAQIEKQLKYQAGDKLRSFRRAVSIGFYGFPDAILFKVAAEPANPSGTITRVVVKDLYGVVGVTPKRVRDYLTVDRDYVAVISEPDTAPVIQAEGYVVAINEATRAVDIGTAAFDATDVDIDDVLVLYNQVQNAGDTDLDQGMNGMLHLTLGTVVHGISELDNPDWAPAVRELDWGQRLGGASMFRTFEEIDQRSGHRPGWVLTTIEAIAAAGGPVLDQRRYTSDEDTIRLGFRKLNAMGVTVESSPYVPPGFAFFGSNSALRKLQPGGKEPGTVITSGDREGQFKQYDNTLGFYKDLILRPQLTLRNRLGLGVYSGVCEVTEAEDCPSPEAS